MSKKEEKQKGAVLTAFIDTTLEKEAFPLSVFKFCKDNDIEEKFFYKHFGSLDAVKGQIWEFFYDNAMGLLEKDAKAFEKELAKAFEKDLIAGYPKGTLGPAGKNLSKIDALRRMSSDAKSAGRPLTPAEMEAIIKDVASENKLKAATHEGKGGGNKPKKEEQQKWDNEPDPTKKKWNWKRMLKWGAAAGVSAAALYWIYTKTHGRTPPVPVPPPVPPVPPVPVPPRPSQYRSCPDTFPIAQFCKNETVRKVQGCLGITADAKFGPNTKTALEGKGLNGTSITQDTVNKVCNTNTSQVNPDVEDVDGQDPNTI